MSRTPRTQAEIRDARAIRERLKRVYSGVTTTALGKRLGLGHTTVSGWFNEPPTTPDPHHLLRIARRDHVSLNHLLLDDGPERRGQLEVRASLAEKVRAHLLAEVRPRLGRVPTDLVERWLPSGEEILEQAAVSYATEIEAKYGVYRERFLGERARLHESEMIDYHRGEIARLAKSHGTDSHELAVSNIKDELGEALASEWVPPVAEGSATTAPRSASPEKETPSPDLKAHVPPRRPRSARPS